MDGVVENALAHFLVGSSGIGDGSGLQRIRLGKDYCKIFLHRRGKVNGHFAVEEKRVADGSENRVAQNGGFGYCCERWGRW